MTERIPGDIDENRLCEQFRGLVVSFETATAAQLQAFRAAVSESEFARVYPTGPVVDLRTDNVTVMYERICSLLGESPDNDRIRTKVLPVVGNICSMWKMRPRYGLVTDPTTLERLFAQAKIKGCKKLVANLKSKTDEIAWQTDDGLPETKWEDYDWSKLDQMPSQWDRLAHARQMIGTGDTVGTKAPPIPIVYRWAYSGRGSGDGYSKDTVFDRRTKETRETTFEKSRVHFELPQWVTRSRQWTQIISQSMPERGCLPTDKYTVYAAFVRDPDAPALYNVQTYVGSTTKTPNERWIRHVNNINAVFDGRNQSALLAEFVMARAYIENCKSWDDVVYIVCLASFRPVNASKDTRDKAKSDAKRLESTLIEDMRLCHAVSGLNARGEGNFVK